MADQTLAQRIRAEHPGAYDDMDDATLEAAVVKKYPGTYDDIPRTVVGPTPTAQVGPGPEPDEARRRHVMSLVDTGEHLGGPIVPMGAPMGLLGGAAKRAAAPVAASIATRVGTAAKSAAEFATPIVKFEIVKRTLQGIGVPADLADLAAITVSGYKRGGKASREDDSGATRTEDSDA